VSLFNFLTTFPECIDSNTFLNFKELGHDSGYGTLIEKLGEHIRRLEIDDEFVAYVRSDLMQFDYCKVKAQNKSEIYCKFTQRIDRG
jgi:hypothetical protein